MVLDKLQEHKRKGKCEESVKIINNTVGGPCEHQGVLIMRHQLVEQTISVS